MQALEIATVEDLVRVLDEHPQWLEALRTRLLTRELLALPQTLADFVAATDRRFAEIDRRFAEVDRRFAEVDGRFDVLERQMGQLRNDVAPIKAAHARNAAMNEADLIAEELGLSLVGILDQAELRSLARSADTAGISKHDLRSFRAADLVLRVADPAAAHPAAADPAAAHPAGTERYVAVEVSYTANGRDTERARRNARFLTRFTGCRASAVVAALRLDERIRPIVESGEVAWYRLPAEALEVD